MCIWPCEHCKTSSLLSMEIWPGVKTPIQMFYCTRLTSAQLLCHYAKQTCDTGIPPRNSQLLFFMNTPHKYTPAPRQRTGSAIQANYTTSIKNKNIRGIFLYNIFQLKSPVATKTDSIVLVQRIPEKYPFVLVCWCSVPIAVVHLLPAAESSSKALLS